RRGASLVAWTHVGGSADGGAQLPPLRIVGGHPDSPCLRLKPRPDTASAGWQQLAVEVYGGVLLNSWLDRDLGIAGRVVSTDGEVTLFRSSSAVARIPQLAIHLDRDVSERGLVLDKQAHLVPVWGTAQAVFKEWLHEVSGTSNIAAFDAHLFDVTPASLVGHDASLLSSARLDNQVSCWAAIEAMAHHSPGETTAMMVLNDHEEVGSASATGAAGPLLVDVIAALCEQENLDASARRDRISESWCLSADNAHAIHPNYPERHEPRHAPRINAGPALKLNGNQRYATSSRGAAHITRVADEAGLPLQVFMSRNNMPCGSTIGPITATVLGIEAIDVGVPQWAMHSARETCGADDPSRLSSLMSAFIAN
ncbi:MAG: M18 family aminopeptidase, partial [Ilumatobacteraceae bacterium]